ncbi:unconventional myosin-XVIIIa [Crotalus adamanteus]|uniref:Unconventional myosin-XVIIIa n=1 Tax=Crotalus adamanteus TaxID=8729 RepID=A0AAW1CFJ0_CROAD
MPKGGRGWALPTFSPSRHWRRVKDEDKVLAVKKSGKEEAGPDSPVAETEASRHLQSPEPPKRAGKAKNPEPLINGEAQPPSPAVNGLEGPHAAVSEPQPGTPGEDPHGLSGTKVAKAVRSLVHKVLPGDDAEGAKGPPKPPKSPQPGKKQEKAPCRVRSPPPRLLSPPPRPSPKPQPTGAPPKDDLSVGLKSLMSRAKIREHRPHSRQQRGKKEEAAPPEKTQPPPLAEGKPSEAQSPPEARPPSGGLAKTPSQEAGPTSQTSPPAQPEDMPPPCPTAGEMPKQPEPVSAVAAPGQAKTEEQIAAEEAWCETEKVWLVHKDGFSLASQLKSDAASALPEGKVKVKLDYDGAILEVDEDDIEKANPPSCDRLEDLANLVYLNESSALHTLRQRYGGNLIHTYAGPNLVVINPLSSPSMYSEKVMHMFKGCRKEETSPHVYALAQAAYRAMLMSRQDQSLVFLGSSGSGKSTSAQHLVQYLATIAGSPGRVFSVEKWQALYTILEAFGNSSTSLNSNASRFSQIISLDFDQAGQVASASVQTMLLEKLRVAKHPTNEGTFNVFYYLLACPDNALRTELHFNHLAENNVFGILPLSKPEEKQKAAQQFSRLQAAMKVMCISGEEQKAFWLVLGAICHLGAAGATKDSSEGNVALRSPQTPVSFLPLPSFRPPPSHFFPSSFQALAC